MINVKVIQTFFLFSSKNNPFLILPFVRFHNNSPKTSDSLKQEVRQSPHHLELSESQQPKELTRYRVSKIGLCNITPYNMQLQGFTDWWPTERLPIRKYKHQNDSACLQLFKQWR